MVAGATLPPEVAILPPPLGQPSETAYWKPGATNVRNLEPKYRTYDWQSTRILAITPRTGKPVPGDRFYAKDDVCGDRWSTVRPLPPSKVPATPASCVDHHALVRTKDPWNAPKQPGRYFDRPWPRFMPAAFFADRRRGYYYQLGERGMGYYLDPSQGYLLRPRDLRPSNVYWL